MPVDTDAESSSDDDLDRALQECVDGSGDEQPRPPARKKRRVPWRRAKQRNSSRSFNAARKAVRTIAGRLGRTVLLIYNLELQNDPLILDLRSEFRSLTSSSRYDLLNKSVTKQLDQYQLIVATPNQY